MISNLRPETPDDEAAISETIALAFENHPYSQGTEAEIVRYLRNAGALTISLVAQIGDRIGGHVAVSPIEIIPKSDGWFGLGPVAVLPSFQRQGIGKALIEAALDQLEARGAQGCVVLGNPAYYRRFNFEASKCLTLEGVPPDYFLMKPFGAPPPAGVVRYHAAFDAKA